LAWEVWFGVASVGESASAAPDRRQFSTHFCAFFIKKASSRTFASFPASVGGLAWSAYAFDTRKRVVFALRTSVEATHFPATTSSIVESGFLLDKPGLTEA